MTDKEREEQWKRAQSYFKKPLKKADREADWSEDYLTGQVVSYLKTHHPNVPFQVDLSGEYFGKTRASKNSNRRAEGYHQPDITIYVAKKKYGVLALELKKLSQNPLKKNGELKASPHLANQAHSIKWLRKYGQCADFAVGYEDTIKKINAYLDTGEFEYLLK